MRICLHRSYAPRKTNPPSASQVTRGIRPENSLKLEAIQNRLLNELKESEIKKQFKPSNFTYNIALG